MFNFRLRDTIQFQFRKSLCYLGRVNLSGKGLILDFGTFSVCKKYPTLKVAIISYWLCPTPTNLKLPFAFLLKPKK